MAEAAAAASSSSSPFFVLSARPFQFYFKFSLPCFMFSFCFVNLARDWVLEMIKRFDKSFISICVVFYFPFIFLSPSFSFVLGVGLLLKLYCVT